MRKVTSVPSILWLNFHENILVAPQERHAHEPILAREPPSGGRPILGWQDSCLSGELWANDFSAHRAWRYADLRIIANPFVFSRVASGHHVELSALFCKP